MDLRRARRLRIAWWLAFACVVAFYLVTAHRAHLAGLREWLPLLVLLACPLMHLFGHRHGQHAGRPKAGEQDRRP
ncbi:MAG TPA: DUF2933 domain-containing protein [Xanthomonadaceae bacterium]|nr:DUF2933 domain-containing protein [Xanthomonadaceae bacterium]